MPIFQYKAKKETETVTGRIEARNKDEAVDIINNQGMIPVSVDEWHRGIKGSPSIKLISRKVTGKDIYMAPEAFIFQLFGYFAEVIVGCLGHFTQGQWYFLYAGGMC